jgi:hypothetical protein
MGAEEWRHDHGRTWRPLPGTTLLGSSHTYDRTNTHFLEHLRITATIGQLDGSRAQSFVFQSFVFKKQ